MRIDVVTLFPDYFESPLAIGLVGRAFQKGTEFGIVDPRAFTQDVHRTVDDSPYGGGAGMVLKPEPIVAALNEAKSRGSGPVVMLSPQGAPLRQSDLRRWSKLDHLVLLCGRYEGFDERIRAHVDEEISLGDFVLTGGEPAAAVIIDGVVRLLPETLGNAESIETDSFSDGLLEHPHYTRPLRFEESEVPPILRSGDHKKVERWRRARALERTSARRPELLAQTDLDLADQQTLAAQSKRRPIHLALELEDPSAAVRARGLAHAFRLASLSFIGSALQLDHPEAIDLAPPGTKKRDRATVSPAWPRDIHVFPDWSAWSMAQVEAGRPRFGLLRRPYRQPGLWRGEAPAEAALALGAGLLPEHLDHRLAPLAAATPGARLDVVTAAALGLQRMFATC